MNFISEKTLNIAHRGARSLAPENTIVAAQKAHELGADLWELDVCVTADGELILLHDHSLTRTSNAREVYPDRHPWHVRDFTLEEIRQLDFGSWFIEQDPFGQIATQAVSHPEQNLYSGEPAPTLREALEFTRQNNWAVNIEIKDLRGSIGDRFIVEKTTNLVIEMELTTSVIISSFNHAYLRRCRDVAPQIQTAALVTAMPLAPIHMVRRLGATACNPPVQFLNLWAVCRLRDAGYGVNIYTVNDAPTMARLVSAGVSGIFTDFPQVLNRILKD